MKKLISAVAITAISGSALAAGAFDGPFVQLGIGGVGTQNNVSYQGDTATLLNIVGVNTNQTTDGGSFVGRVDAGWSQAIDKFNLAGGLFYVIGNQSAGSDGFSKSGRSGSNTATLSGGQNFSLQNSWGINVEPGYYVTDSTLGYLKFSWFNSTVNASSNIGANWNIGGTAGSASANSTTNNTVNGAGFGIGAKQMFSNNIYGYLEYQYVTYGSVTDGTVGASYKPSQNYGMVGVGYKF